MIAVALLNIRDSHFLAKFSLKRETYAKRETMFVYFQSPRHCSTN